MGTNLVPNYCILDDFSVFFSQHFKFQTLFIYPPGQNVSMANQWLHEFVFWAASLATTETRLQLLPADWFRGSQGSKVLEVIDASVGVPWRAKELNMAIESDCEDPLYE